MARFLGGLNDEISSFVEMFPYNTLQDLVDQAMRTERKIQQEGRGKSYGSNPILARTSFGGGRSQGAASRSCPCIAPLKTVVSTASSLATQQRPAGSTAAPHIASAATSSTRS